MTQLIAIITFVIAGSAHAQSSYDILIPRRSVLTADLTAVKNISSPGFLPEEGVSGELVIDKRMKNVILNLRVQDEMDVTFSRAVFQTSLKLLSITKDEQCGTITYIAGTDPRALERHVESLVIVDNTKNVCQVEDRVYAPTEVRLQQTINGIVFESNSADLSFTALKKQTIE